MQEDIKKRYKPFDELTLRDDFMFAIIMRRKEFCIPFLEMLLNIKIIDIVYSDSQVSIDAESDAKSIRLDVYVDDGKGTVYDIEMQNSKPKYIGKRFRYYQSVIDTKILDKGINYDDLKKSFIIFICTFDPFNKGLPVYTFRNIAEEDKNVYLNDESCKIILNSTAYESCSIAGIRSFLGYLETGSSTDDFTLDIDKAISEARHNRERRDQYMTYARKMYEEFSEGRAEGKAEGQVIGKIIAYADVGFSAYEISQKLNITEDEVKKILQENQ